MTLLKRLGLFFLTGAILGVVAGTLLAAAYLPWYNAPGTGQALCNCQETVHNTLSSLLHFQLVGAVTGGVLLAIVFVLVALARRRSKLHGAKIDGEARPS